MQHKEKRWRVGEIAKRAGISVATLHFYESTGLLQSSRNAGNQRCYKPSVLRRIGVIKTAQRLGVSLKEIKQALDTLPKGRTPNAKDWQKLSRQWRADLDTRIRQLQKLRDQLDGCIGCGCLSLKQCALRNPHDDASNQGVGAVYLQANY